MLKAMLATVSKGLPKTLHSMLAYAAGIAITKGLALIMLPMMAGYLEPEQLGELELWSTIATFMALLSGMALTEALYRFAGEVTDAARQKKLAGQLLTLSQLTAVALGLLVWLLSVATGLDSWPLRLILLGLVSDGAIGIAMAWLRMQDKALPFLLICVSTALLQALLILLALKMNYGVTGILTASVTAHIIQLALLLNVTRLRYALPKPEQTRQLLSYSLPLMLAALLGFGLNGAERWLMAATTSLHTLGHYAIAAKFALAMCILVQPFGMWWMPKRFHSLQHRGKQATSITAQYGIVWICVVTVTMAGAAQLFIVTMLPASYLPACDLLLVALVVAWGKEVTEQTNLGLLYMKRPSLLLGVNLFTTFFGLGGAWFASRYGVFGILYALLAAQLLRTALITVISQRLYALPYQWMSLSLLAVATFSGLLFARQMETVTALLLFTLTAPGVILLLSMLTRLLPTTPLRRYVRSPL